MSAFMDVDCSYLSIRFHTSANTKLWHSEREVPPSRNGQARVSGESYGVQSRVDWERPARLRRCAVGRAVARARCQRCCRAREPPRSNFHPREHPLLSVPLVLILYVPLESVVTLTGVVAPAQPYPDGGVPGLVCTYTKTFLLRRCIYNAT
ncbi:hypothetical protein C8Q76DRAFT_861203 [Earliella scabrosa]|nr:hypothetical protein C8Q76DRAFT_861203 [Earliella scabrosa]